MFDTFISNSTSIITNTVPSARSIFKPILFVLISFDDLFPYMYHERDYGNAFDKLFASIHTAETTKWETYDKYILDPIHQRTIKYHQIIR